MVYDKILLMRKSIIFILILIFVLTAAFYLKKNLMYDLIRNNASNSQKTLPKGKLIGKIALLADSHTDYQRLEKSLDKAKENEVSFVVHFGDLSDFGGFSELSSSKKILDDSGIPFLVLPGDRDVVEGGVNFKQIFSEKLCTLQLSKYKIYCLINPYNYTLLDSVYLNGFYTNLQKALIIFSSQPIYNPRSNVYMGYYNDSVKAQADEIYLKLQSSNVKYVFSGDAHFFSKNSDSKIDYYNLGAITNRKNLQTPNFTILTVYENTISVQQINLD